MTDMDYSKTRIFERHTNLETTNKKNAELKEMYQTFYNEMYQAFNIKKKVKFETKNTTASNFSLALILTLMQIIKL